MMKRTSVRLITSMVLCGVLTACAVQREAPGWITLIDGDQGLHNWVRQGDANWRASDGAIVADAGTGGFLVSKSSYQDFVIRAEFWAETHTNSGIFVRASNPDKIGSSTAYEVNVWDLRPDPTYGTGAVVDHAAVPVPSVHKAGGRWNVMEIEARGARLSVKLNGVTTATMESSKHTSGPFALQFGSGVQGATGGPIKWRKVQIRPL